MTEGCGDERIEYLEWKNRLEDEKEEQVKFLQEDIKKIKKAENFCELEDVFHNAEKRFAEQMKNEDYKEEAVKDTPYSL